MSSERSGKLRREVTEEFLYSINSLLQSFLFRCWCIDLLFYGFQIILTITVNFPDELLPPDQAYLDTNNVPEIEQFIEDNKLGKPKHRHHI